MNIIRRLLLVAGLLVMLAVPTNTASAEPHAVGSVPHTVCEVNAFLWFGPPGIDPNPSNGHYEFLGTELDCEGLRGGFYDMFASGDTTDLWHRGTGEDCDQGGSVRIGDELHTGQLTAEGIDWRLESDIHFTRLGWTMLVDGPVSYHTQTSSDSEHFLTAELEFVPTEGDCTKESPLMEAALTGTAQIYSTDPAFLHLCTPDDDHDPHCT